MNIPRLRIALVLVLLAALAGCGPDVPSVEGVPEAVDFNLHVRPILSDRCFACHGPDTNTREAGLRLDTEEGAFAALASGGHAIVPGRPGRSTLVRRITASDPDVVMPPPESNLALSDYEVAVLARWIEQGAEWKRHWAFIPPEPPPVPDVQDEAWPRNSIDRFVLARLEREGLAPQPEADEELLLRRVTLDLTGLPPTPDEVDAFLDDDRPDAYGRVVDRLLASPSYGERLATDWLDLARYADSHGYHADGARTMWPWRDWVIGAFNENMPYDEFITWQVAGDLLPGATREQILATAFGRNHPMNSELGIVDEEYRLENVFDRVATTGRAFLGLTVDCARCHDHKYDPIAQEEFFGLAAFYNTINEAGMIGNDGNAGPNLLLPDAATERTLEAVRQTIAEHEAALARRAAAVEEGGVPEGLGDAVAPSGLIAHYPLDEIREGKAPNRAPGGTPAGVSGEPEAIAGYAGGALRFGRDYDFLSLTDVGRFERYEPFSIGLWVRPEQRDDFMSVVANSGQKNNHWRGYELTLDSLGRASVRLMHAYPDNLLHVTATDPVPLDAWTHLAFTYDGSGRADGVRIYLDGEATDVEVRHDNLYKSIRPVRAKTFAPENRPLRVGKSYRAGTGSSGDAGLFVGGIDELKVYGRMLTAAEVAGDAGRDALGGALATPPRQRSAEQQRLVLEHHLYRHDGPYRALLADVQAARERELDLLEPIPEVMVMKEMRAPRPTYVLDRGAYDAPTQRVEPGTPEAVLAFPDSLPPNRLGLARWLTSPQNPLPARVTVNRYWQMLFGAGLVKTADDFGNQGELPSHPALLDHLATAFVDSGWDVKALLKSMVMSATYRQRSKAPPEVRQRDPENRLLARGPSGRLPAEMLRDQALAASGLLVDRVGGPSVKPYQPPGLWREKGEFSHDLLTYEQDHGEALYRRSLYTFIRRTSPPPAMLTFDAPDRNVCVVSRQATNTPLQSLVLLNDPQFVEAARVLAERMQREGGPDLASRLTYGFRLLAGRDPAPRPLDALTRLYHDERARFKAHPEQAAELLAVGEWPRDETLEPAETAALAAVANVMMNHDDAYTKR